MSEEWCPDCDFYRDELRDAQAENERQRARLAEAERLLLDMRQHQGRIQPYVEQIDAFLAGEKP